MAIHGHPAGEIASAQQAGFLTDVLQGLRASQKYLPSKYFYDQAGDALFQQIMQLPEYYPTRCETEILEEQAGTISTLMAADESGFDLVELGAGDATKSRILIECFLKNELDFDYIPIDISANVIEQLHATLPLRYPQLSVRGVQGDYFEQLQSIGVSSKRRKLVLFLGGNIGNYQPEEARDFLAHLQAQLSPGDFLLTGFDLKKHPLTILNAYNDSAGVTKAFNFNLLDRINRELSADFNRDQFDHYPTYDPATGACRSFLISLSQQTVTIGGKEEIYFSENEPIFMEISQKYDLNQIEALAAETGFKTVFLLQDRKNWFVDAIWEKG